MSGIILLCAVLTCCWSLMDYRKHSLRYLLFLSALIGGLRVLLGLHAKLVIKDKNQLDSQTTDYVHARLHASAKSHRFCHREWLLLRWGCQLMTMLKPHKGDPYLRSQRALVFANALLVSLVCSILFYSVPGEPECCTCISGVCGENSSTWASNTTCTSLGIAEGNRHCEDGVEVDNGILASILCAALSLPIVATMHMSFRWVRKPLERFIMVKVLQHHQRNIIVSGAIDLVQTDMMSNSDPYCKVFFNGRLIGRTKVMIGSQSPSWWAAFNIVDEIGPIPETENTIRFEVWDHDMFSSDDFLGQATLRGRGVEMLPASVTAFELQPEEENRPVTTQRSMSVRDSNEQDNRHGIQGKICVFYTPQEVESLGHMNPHRPSPLWANHAFVYPDDDPEQDGHRVRCCRCMRSGLKNGHPKYPGTRSTVAPATAVAEEADDIDVIDGGDMHPKAWGSPRSGQDPAAKKSAEAPTSAGKLAKMLKKKMQNRILDAKSVDAAADRFKHHTMPRGFAKTMLAYTYCFIVGVACSLVIAGEVFTDAPNASMSSSRVDS